MERSQPLPVLVTGSTGLIGRRIVEDLSRTYRVVGLDLPPPPKDEHLAQWVECDLTDDAAVARALQAVRDEQGPEIASVVHLAAYYDFSGEPSPLYDELTVAGTRRLLRGLHATFETVEQFVFSSSLLVMKPGEDPIDEDSPVEAEWDYPRSKLAAEAVIREEHGDISAVVLRIAGVYDADGHSLPLTQQMVRIREKQFESYFFPGDADHGQPFLHLDDLVSCLRAAVDRRHDLGAHELFLVAEPEIVSYGELQDRIGSEVHGREWPTVRIPRKLAEAGAWVQDKLPGKDPFIKPWMIDMADAHYPVRIDRVRSRLGWEPRHRLRDELSVMVRRMRDDPLSWYEENDLPLPDDLEEAPAARPGKEGT